MATLVFSLSTKVDKVSGLSEILTRFFVGSRINQRAKSNIFVDAAYWNDQKQSIVIPNFRLNNARQKQLVAELNEKCIKLNDLITHIMDAFNEDGAGMKELTKDWLKNIIKDFYVMPAKPMEDLKSVEIPNAPIIIKPVEKEVKTEPVKKVVKVTPKPQPSQDSAPTSVFFSVFADFIAKNDISENRKRHYRVVYRALQRYEVYNKITLIFYNMNLRLEWCDVFSEGVVPLDDYFIDLGQRYFQFYQTLQQSQPIRFSLSVNQQKEFNQFFTEIQQEYSNLFGLDIVASVRRLGLITFRVAMILTSLRLMDGKPIQSVIVCDDTDFRTSLIMARVLLQHTANVFGQLQHVAHDSYSKT